MRIQEEICRKLWKSSPPKSTDEAQTCFSLEILCTEWMNGRKNAHSSLTGAKSPKILSLFWLLGHQTNVKIRKRTIISLRICSVFATLFTVKWWFSICWTIIILSLFSAFFSLSEGFNFHWNVCPSSVANCHCGLLFLMVDTHGFVLSGRDRIYKFDCLILLSISTVGLILLSISTVGMEYRIYKFDAKFDDGNVWSVSMFIGGIKLF